MLSRHDARPFRVAASAAVALVAFALSQASLAQAPAAPTVPDEAPPSAVERWSDELWDAARRGERSKTSRIFSLGSVAFRPLLLSSSARFIGCLTLPPARRPGHGRRAGRAARMAR